MSNAANAAKETSQIVYLPSSVISLPLPCRSSEARQYTRRDGAKTMTITAAHPDYGLPCGVYARAVMSYICTQAVTSRRRQIKMDGLIDHLKIMGIKATSAAQTRLALDQTVRLAHCVFLVSDSRQDAIRSNIYTFGAESKTFKTLGEIARSTVTISSELFISLIGCDGQRAAAVPLAADSLAGLAGSPFGQDVYSWLAWRTARCAARTVIPWQALASQLGPIGGPARSFRRDFKAAVRQIAVFWPGLRMDLENNAGLVLYPSSPQVPRRRVK